MVLSGRFAGSVFVLMMLYRISNQSRLGSRTSYRERAIVSLVQPAIRIVAAHGEDKSDG